MKQELNAGREGKNLMPSKADQRTYLKRLREAANSGDITAMAALLNLAKLDELIKAQRPAVQSGWVGDEGDPKAAILAAIRTNEPDSKQLPENQ